eukprot:623451_1
MRLMRLITKRSLPLTIVNSDEFIRFCQGLNESWPVPNYDNVSNELLDEFYELCEGHVNDILKSWPSCTFGLDGSDDGCSDPIEHVLAMRGKIAFLLDEYQMYNTEKSADNLKKLLDKALQRLDALHTEWALIESPIHYA